MIDVFNAISGEFEISLKDIALPLLNKVKNHCKHSSPPPQMLNFLVTILSSLE